MEMRKPAQKPTAKSTTKKGRTKRAERGTKSNATDKAATVSQIKKSEVPKSASDIASLGQHLKHQRRQARHGLYDALQDVCVYAERLEKSAHSVRWFMFRRDPIWEDYTERERPKKDQNEMALRFAVRLMWDNSPGGRKSASLYTRALTRLREDGVPTDRIAAELKARGGAKKVAARLRADKPDGSEDDAPTRKPKSTYVTIEANVTAPKGFNGMKADQPYLLRAVPRVFAEDGKVHIDITDITPDA